jgi:hypothetical protein
MAADMQRGGQGGDMDVMSVETLVTSHDILQKNISYAVYSLPR